MKETGKFRVAKTAAALLGAVVFAMSYPALEPGLQAILGRATVLSAAFAMPEGAIATLRDRFLPQDSIQPPQELQESPSSSQSQAESSSAPPAQSSAPSSESSQSSSPPQQTQDIPEQYRRALVTTHMTGDKSNPAFYVAQNAWVRNYTKLSPEEIAKVLRQPAAVTLKKSSQPQVLIYHTHATESYEEYDGSFYDTRNNWRSLDNNSNMVAVGEELAQELEAMGLTVLHDTTQHDHPSYNGAYDRSAVTISSYLKKYPSIRVAIDVHRDAVLYDDGSIIKTVQEVNGRKAAQLMVIAPCDDGTVNLPGWKENFRFAVGFTDAVERRYPGLMRPVFFCYRNYNLGMTPDSLLFEFGTNGNTLEEARYTARLVGPVLGEYLLGNTER